MVVKKLLVLAMFLGMICTAAVSEAGTEFMNTAGGLYVVNCNESISLREYPSTEADAILQIPLGAKVQVLPDSARGSDFAHVSYKGETGYALRSYLTPRGYILQVVNCESWVSLRSAPSTDAVALENVPLGQHVRFVKDAENGFTYVAYQETLGYILNEYLE